MTHVQSIWTAVEVYRRLDDITPEEVKELADWCKNHKEQIPPNLNEEQLILFLHSCYNNLENTKKCMIEYYSLRRKVKHLFQNRDVTQPELKKALKVLSFGIIKPRTPEGYKIVYHRLNDTDPANYVYNDGFKLMVMAMDGLYAREGPLPGLVLLFDFAGVKLGHVTRLPLSSIKRTSEYIQDANPVRLKGIHVINCSPIIDKVMILLKPFLRKNLLAMLHFYKENDDSVYEHIPKECMPSNHGGNYITVEKMHEEFKAEMENLHPLFVEEDRRLKLAFKSRKGAQSPEDEIDLASLEID